MEDWPFGLEELESYYDKVEYELGMSGQAIVSVTSMRDAVMRGGKGGSCAPRSISSRPASRSAYPVLL